MSPRPSGLRAPAHQLASPAPAHRTRIRDKELANSAANVKARPKELMLR